MSPILVVTTTDVWIGPGSHSCQSCGPEYCMLRIASIEPHSTSPSINFDDNCVNALRSRAVADAEAEDSIYNPWVYSLEVSISHLDSFFLYLSLLYFSFFLHLFTKNLQSMWAGQQAELGLCIKILSSRI